MIGEAELKTTRLAVVGNINRDIKTTAMRPGDYLFSDGETSVTGLHETIGGGGANSACIAAALGAQVNFLGRLGVDRLGKTLAATMTRHGVGCHLKNDPDRPTGTTVNLVFDTGSRHFISCHPNNESLRFDDLNLAVVAETDHLLRADIWFSDSMLSDGNERLFRHAKEVGTNISIDVNWDPRWNIADRSEVEARKSAIRQLLPLVDLVHGNVRELSEFAGCKDLHKALDRILEWGTTAVVVHMGSKGAGFYADGHLFVQPPTTVQQPRAVTGSGDVLSVCMILMRPYADVSVGEKLRLANEIVAEFMEGERTLIPELIA